MIIAFNDVLSSLVSTVDCWLPIAVDSRSAIKKLLASELIMACDEHSNQHSRAKSLFYVTEFSFCFNTLLLLKIRSYKLAIYLEGYNPGNKIILKSLDIIKKLAFLSNYLTLLVQLV